MFDEGYMVYVIPAKIADAVASSSYVIRSANNINERIMSIPLVCVRVF